MHRHQDRGGSDHRYRGEILLGVEGQLRINTWINDMAGRHQQQRVTVRRRLGGGGRAERAASATAIVDHHRLAQARMQLLAEDAADNIGAAACRVWHDEPDRSRRERFRPANGSGQNYRRSAEQRDELAPPHSITLSARKTRPAGISYPIASAVLRLITSSNVVGCSTGRSAGLAPLSILATIRAR